MSGVLDLKHVERKAYRSTYQDGLWDVYMGLVVVGLSIYAHRPEGGFSVINWIGFVVTFVIANIIFWVGKKFITTPRMGQVRFGLIRQQKRKTLAIIMGIVVLIQIIVVGLTTFGWLNPVFGSKLFGSVNMEHLAVSALAALFVGPPMLFIAFMNDFPRGYYIAILMALAVFLIIYLNQPLYPLILGGLIIVPGLVLFIRFLRTYPLPQGDESNG
jgi:hypothetical protein